MASPWESLGLGRVINASGKMTALGGTAQTETVARAQADAARHHVDLAALRRLAGRRLAERTGAAAASVTTGAAAGIAVGVAAMITGTDQAAIQQLPDTGDLADEILLQAGHDVNFGARVSQMIRLGGGRPVLVGSPEEVTAADFERMISQRTAGLMFVQSHHTRQARGLELAEVVDIGRSRGLSVLVDAAAEEDLTAYVEQGADLVTYSGGKAIGGPTIGFIAGSAELVAACESQQTGIARAMKVGKEQILGLLVALDEYAPSEDETETRLRKLVSGLAKLPGIHTSIEADRAGREIQRVGVRMDSAAALHELVQALYDGSPSIRTRNHHLDEGLVLFDVREVRTEDVPVVVRRVSECLIELVGGG
jgi:uncharacterized pyridoxal phosphate-dependent enzyme